mgnify:CR=1 FL=1
MDHYLEIRVLPDPEFSSEMLMAALFAKLHRVLGARGQGDIGVRFPDVNVMPGTHLRLHGSAQAYRGHYRRCSDAFYVIFHNHSPNQSL